MSFAFDTLAYVRKLRDAKVPPEQAEAMADAISASLTPLSDITIKADLLQVKTELQADTKLLRQELIAMEHRLTIRLGGFMVAIAGLMLAINKLW